MMKDMVFASPLFTWSRQLQKAAGIHFLNTLAQFVGPDLFGINVADFGYLMSYSAVLSLFANVFIVVCHLSLPSRDNAGKLLCVCAH